MKFTEHAKREFALTDTIDPGMREDILKILRLVDSENYTGVEPHKLLDWVQRALQYYPFSPLTGEDSEWVETDDPNVLQNMRCPTVFKDSNGRTYDIDLMDGTSISFPYMP